MGATSPTRQAPQLWVFAGPNGAGKSTLAAKQVRGRLPVVNPDEIARAKNLGYVVRLFYVGLDDLALSVDRVATRVAAGGHDVPRADLFRRFERSRANLAGALRLADRAYVIDDSDERRRLVMVRNAGRTRRVSSRLPTWVVRVLPPDLLDRDAPEPPG